MLDSVLHIETPEGIELNLRPSGMISRSLAWLIDFTIRLLILFALAIALGMMGRFGIGLFLIAWFLMEWFYPLLFEVYRQGATPGKRAMGIKVVHEDGTPIGWSASMIRNLLRGADFLPFFYTFGLISMWSTRDFKRLGDIVAGTLVVYHEATTSKSLTIPENEPHPPPFPLRLEEQGAILALAERSATLTPERAEELAQIVPLLSGTKGAKQMYSIAGWLVGQR